MNPVVLFREDSSNSQELEIAKKYFRVFTLRTEVFNNSLVIGRYSCLPFYREWEKDLANKHCRPINSYREHQYIANFDYYEDVKRYTFKTYDDSNFYTAPEGPYVVKGRTNSRKWDWSRLMFAPTKKDASRIAAELAGDGLIGPQGILYREYRKLQTYEHGINGLPFTNEWRFFFYRERLLTYGYYWSVAENIKLSLPVQAINLAKEIANIVKNNVNFFVLDMAQTDGGDWVLIEVNDGQMSGLSECSADILYWSLKKCRIS